MAYSSIRIQPCKFPGCPQYPQWGCEGFCWRHRPQQLSARKTTSPNKERQLESGENYVISLSAWFIHHMRYSPRICQNCGNDLFDYCLEDWHSSQHHVLEKEIFPSVQNNLLNHLVLGKWCCHSQWHTSYANASKMEVFPQAAAIVRELYPKLPPEEKRRVSEYYTFSRV